MALFRFLTSAALMASCTLAPTRPAIPQTSARLTGHLESDRTELVRDSFPKINLSSLLNAMHAWLEGHTSATVDVAVYTNCSNTAEYHYRVSDDGAIEELLRLIADTAPTADGVAVTTVWELSVGTNESGDSTVSATSSARIGAASIRTDLLTGQARAITLRINSSLGNGEAAFAVTADGHLKFLSNEGDPNTSTPQFIELWERTFSDRLFDIFPFFTNDSNPPTHDTDLG
jgi:hypothetical protein